MNRRNFLGVTTGGILLPIKPSWLSERIYLEKLFGITTIRSFLGDVVGPPWKTVYKLVNRRYESLYACAMPTDVRLKYNIGDIVKPNFGKIFTFGNIDDAKLELSRSYERKLLECKTRYYSAGIGLYEPLFTLNSENWIKNWHKQAENTAYHDQEVIFCDDLRVVKEL